MENNDGSHEGSLSSVEAVRFHPVLVEPLLPPADMSVKHGIGSTGAAEPSTIVDRIRGWQSAGMSKLAAAGRALSQRSSTMKTSLKHQVSKVKPMVSKVRPLVLKVRPTLRGIEQRAESQLRSNPAKWAGIAAGLGFAVGAFGRSMRNRSGLRGTRVPRLLVIERSC